ncbi:hypothetical protein [Actinocrispum sp. NPDC049592]|uniref:nSTAND1 domain-containing NTPase n=1 Tax=Actinocrispum sp. NPDC049592 TaxID=3154835 RepID=UPI0034252ADF
MPSRKSYRALATETGLGFTIIAGYCSGRHLPQLSVGREFSRLLTAMGVRNWPSCSSGSKSSSSRWTPSNSVRSLSAPAHAVGLELQDGLVDLLLRETEGEPGVLPLLSHTLRAIVELTHTSAIRIDQYREAGGVQGAIARTADSSYHSLSAERQVIARNLCLRLVATEENTADTRRRVTFDELFDGRSASESDARAERPSSSTALDWAAEPGPRASLNPLEQDFLAASQAARSAQQAADRRRVRRRYEVASAVIVLIVLAVGAGLYARQVSSDARREAELAASREIADRAVRLRERDPALAAQLALAAYRISSTPEALCWTRRRSRCPVGCSLVGRR